MTTTTTTSRQDDHNWQIPTTPQQHYDVIIVGSGLAGLTAALHVLDRGGTVLLMEKEATVGGNSNKASSGMNACCGIMGQNDIPNNTTTTMSSLSSSSLYDDNHVDTLELFTADTATSAGAAAQPPLIETLTGHSAAVWQWYTQRVGVDLSQVAQLGGHSRPRTFRPAVGMVGAALTTALQLALQHYTTTQQLTWHMETRVVELVTDDNHNAVTGVVAQTVADGMTHTWYATTVILATGGFAADKSPQSLVRRYHPEWIHVPTTAGTFSTGDGIHLGLADAVGAATADLERIQMHPTGFVDPTNPAATSKLLAAELLRGVGGILLNAQGQRFCNELGRRDYVSGEMLKQPRPKEEQWPTFALVLSQTAADAAARHVETYTNRGVLTKLHGTVALADWLGVPHTQLVRTLQDYATAAQRGVDDFGKTVFNGVSSLLTAENEVDDHQTFYVGRVTPVLHYCMGGLQIDTQGHVLRKNGQPIPGLRAAGEVTGGVHGVNRLGGNSLLDCGVFGSIVGQSAPIASPHKFAAPPPVFNDPIESSPESLRPITLHELQQHNSEDSLWVAIHGHVYDLTEFAARHPGGAHVIHKIAGTDATRVFGAVHDHTIVQALMKQRVGTFVAEHANAQPATLRTIPLDELQQHNGVQTSTLWVALHGNVYDLTDFAQRHAGGSHMIHKVAGKDATRIFSAVHDAETHLGALMVDMVGIWESDEVRE
uniref:Cytochrome b5 heme-binding domain-containing protein n=1 Tax=Amphora coffeiformis TaxID=265554 RepID=A0A7S3KZI5_9STRA